MTRRLVLSYLSVTAFVLLVLEVPLGVVFARGERRDLESDVKQDALVMALLAEERLEGGGSRNLQELADAYERDVGGRVVIVDAAGVSVADSEPGSPPERNFRGRPEVARALRGHVSSGWRSSETLGADLLYVAVPVPGEASIHGAVRITYRASVLTDRIRRAWLVLAAVGAVVLGTVLLASIALARSVSRPLRDVERAATGFGAGELSVRAPDDAGPPEVRRLARAFNDTADRLQRLLASQEAFVADASHELRTPLGALRLRLENIAASAGGAPAADAESAIVEVRRLSRLIDGLLALARLDGRSPTPRAIDLAPVIDARQRVWEPLADERDVTLATSVPATARALVSEAHLEQVVDNLIANALEVAPPGSTVTVRVEDGDGGVALHVVDEGPGLTEEERARAFDRFWRGDRTTPGSGLGLAIVRRLVELDGGEVGLESAPGGGIDACVRLVPEMGRSALSDRRVPGDAGTEQPRR